MSVKNNIHLLLPLFFFFSSFTSPPKKSLSINQTPFLSCMMVQFTNFSSGGTGFNRRVKGAPNFHRQEGKTQIPEETNRYLFIFVFLFLP
jgi:hypothetical protein